MQITAAVARAKNAPLSIEEVSLSEPRADEVLVRLVAAGICHTDISMRDHLIYPVPHPVVLGHEGAGIVEQLGEGVTRLAVDDPVILTSASCGKCHMPAVASHDPGNHGGMIHSHRFAAALQGAIHRGHGHVEELRDLRCVPDQHLSQDEHCPLSRG